MASYENTALLTGNVTRDPELRYTNSGVAVANFGLASNRRRKDKDGNWVEEDPSFFDVKVWKQVAENLAASVQKGDRVTLVGRMDQEKWEDKESGEPRSKVVFVADEVAVSLRFATVQITKNPKGEGGGGQQGGGFGGGQQGGQQQQQQQGGFGGGQRQQQQQQGGFGGSDEPF